VSGLAAAAELTTPRRGGVTSRHSRSKKSSRSWPDSRTPYPAPVGRGWPLFRPRCRRQKRTFLRPVAMANYEADCL
jgi:hypothetical protein